jgi:hypothetical protein
MLMRARIAAILTLVAALFAVTAIPSHAADGQYLNSFKFWSPVLCMAIGDFGIDAPELAQAWNVQSGHTMQISAKNNCVTAGYPPSRRFTIDTYSGSTSRCYIVTNKYTEPLGYGTDVVAVGGTWQYTDNPIIWINRACYSTFAARRHYTSAGIGSILGLATLNSEALNSRVQNMTAWSIRNVPTADVYSGGVMARLYG